MSHRPATLPWRILLSMSIVTYWAVTTTHLASAQSSPQGEPAGEEPAGGWVGRGSTTEFPDAGQSASHTGTGDPGSGGGSATTGNTAVIGSSMAIAVETLALSGDSEVSIYLKQFRDSGRSNYAGLTNFTSGSLLRPFCAFAQGAEGEYTQWFGQSRPSGQYSGAQIGFRVSHDEACQLSGGHSCPPIRWLCWLNLTGQWEILTGEGSLQDFYEPDLHPILEAHAGMYAVDPSVAGNAHITTWDHVYYYVDTSASMGAWCGALPLGCQYQSPWQMADPSPSPWRCERSGYCESTPMCQPCQLPNYVQPWTIDTWGPREGIWPILRPGALKVFDGTTLHEPSPGDTSWDVCMGEVAGTPCGQSDWPSTCPMSHRDALSPPEDTASRVMGDGRTYFCLWAGNASFGTSRYVPWVDIASRDPTTYDLSYVFAIIAGSPCGVYASPAHRDRGGSTCGDEIARYLMANAQFYGSERGWISPGDRQDSRGVFRLLGDTVPYIGNIEYRNWGENWQMPGAPPSRGYYVEIGFPWTVVPGKEIPAKEGDDRDWAALIVPEGRSPKPIGTWQGRYWVAFDDDQDDDGCGGTCDVSDAYCTIPDRQRADSFCP